MVKENNALQEIMDLTAKAHNIASYKVSEYEKHEYTKPIDMCVFVEKVLNLKPLVLTS